MSREDSYGYDPLQSKAYDSNFDFGTPLDDKSTIESLLYQRDYGPTNLRTYSIRCGLQRIDGAVTTRCYHTTRKAGSKHSNQ
jgi:hypothetical protein